MNIPKPSDVIGVGRKRAKRPENAQEIRELLVMKLENDMNEYSAIMRMQGYSDSEVSKMLQVLGQIKEQLSRTP